ncbi:uncharacterized protein Ir47a [Drosophila bipectinata]|uniref:uncharacterized protein Ir47a n=1 Tax=Drosophila bipectinata TaxID=42026 RepID=UPI0038B34F0F
MRKVTLFLVLLVGAVASLEHHGYISDFLQSVNQTRSFSTLLLLQRRAPKRESQLDILEKHYPFAWPTIRLDENHTIYMVNHYIKHILSLVYIDCLEDAILLDALAENLNHLRNTRIIVWLSIPKYESLLRVIEEKSAEFNFVRVAVVHSASRIYRLQPFPKPFLKLVENPGKNNKIFCEMPWNFMGKKLRSFPDFVPPRSFIRTDPLTGKRSHAGYIYDVIRNFATQYNISLEILKTVNGRRAIPQIELLDITLQGQLDIPMTGQFYNFRHSNESRIYASLGWSSLAIAVPCGEELALYELFQMNCGKERIAFFFLFYISCSVLEFIFIAFSHWIQRKHRRFRFFRMIVNLKVLLSILNMSVPEGNRFRSVKGQLLTAMSATGMLAYCILGAQLSTLLTLNPQYRHVVNFQELIESKTPVLFNRLTYQMIEKHVNMDFLARKLPKALIVSSTRQMELLSTLNANYAYLIFSYQEDPFTLMQENVPKKALCKSPDLQILGGLTYIFCLPRNSIFSRSIRRFSLNAWDTGLMSHWLLKAIHQHVSSLKLQRKDHKRDGV